MSPSSANSGNVAEAKTAPNEFALVVLTAVAATSAAAAVTYLTAAAIVVIPAFKLIRGLPSVVVKVKIKDYRSARAQLLMSYMYV